jgi:hypothetical protein
MTIFLLECISLDIGMLIFLSLYFELVIDCLDDVSLFTFLKNKTFKLHVNVQQDTINNEPTGSQRLLVILAQQSWHLKETLSWPCYSGYPPGGTPMARTEFKEGLCQGEEPGP